MSRKRFDEMHCGVAQALDQVGDWWTLLIVRDAFFGARRFAEFEQGLGIAKNILSDRLQKLVDHGIFEKRPLDEGGRRHEYVLTRKGRDLWVVLTALRLWSDRWVFGQGHEPYLAVDGGTGRVLSGLVAVDENGEPIDPRNLRWETGPGGGSARDADGAEGR
jgi:DNA-binding HxlR family transcriptional regulator